MATHTPEQLRAALRDLLTLEDLAEQLGVTHQSATRYRARGDLPAHDATVGRTPVWFRSTVETFIRDRDARWSSEQPGRGARRDRRRGH
jgi:hypothetical protein